MVIAIESHDPLAAFRAASLQANKLAVADDPLGWAAIALPHISFWSKQIEIMNAVDTHARVAVRACHDSSKSFTAAVIASRWIDKHPVGQARVITTAPTGMQVRGILWVEINQLHEQAKLPGRVNQTEWWIGSYLAGVGRKPADYRPEAFQGLHARYQLIIIDEASGVPASIIDAVETLATNVNAKILMIGNPDDPNSLFAQIHADPDKFGYHTIKIAAWDTPNFTGEPVTQHLSEVLLSTQWVERRRLAWGEDHPFWKSKVEAEFPDQAENAVVRISDLIQCRVPAAERPMTVDDIAPLAAKSSSGQSTGDTQVAGTPNAATLSERPLVLPNKDDSVVALGVDVAGSENGDETVVRLATYPANVNQISNTNPIRIQTEWRIRTAEQADITQLVIMAIQITNATVVNVDSIGIGWGIIGMISQALKQLGKNKDIAVNGINNASKATDPTVHNNKRSELWWTFGRTYVGKQWIDTSVADSQEDLEAQLLASRYHIANGKIVVESKDEMKARLGRSPDNADATLYAIAMVGKSNVLTIQPQPNTILTQPTSMVTTGQRMQPSQGMFGRLPTRRSA